MRFDGLGNVDIGDDLAVDYQESFIFEQVAGVIQRPGRAEDVGLLQRIMDLYPEIAAVAERPDHGIGLMMKIYDNFLKTEPGNILGHITHERLTQKGYRGLCAVDS